MQKPWKLGKADYTAPHLGTRAHERRLLNQLQLLGSTKLSDPQVATVRTLEGIASSRRQFDGDIVSGRSVGKSHSFALPKAMRPALQFHDIAIPRSRECGC